jgi:hypothetical protein
MFTAVAKQARYARFLVNENSTTILTGMGVAGVITTAYLTGRASFKAARLIDKEQRDATVIVADESEDEHATRIEIPEFTTIQKARMVWRLYIPPVLVSTGTITSIIVANKIASKRVAALVIASGISERALQEYKDRVVEKFGENKARDLRDEIAQNRIAGQPVNNEVIVVGTGEVLCYDMHTGRYFNSTHETIKRAENKINHSLVHYCSASLSEFYDEIGLPPTTYSDLVGWDVSNHMEVKVSTVMSPDNRPCLAIDFSNPPVYDYNKLHYGS